MGKPIGVMCVFGTRPEAIKMAPVVKALKQDSRFNVIVCSTGQHKEMLAQVLHFFDIAPDIDLDVMKPNQTLASITASIVTGVSDSISLMKPDVVLVHGDTTTTIAAALASFYCRTPVGHVEAGLRTGNLSAPWPEEANRRLTGVLAAIHFAPTPTARDNLIAEGTKHSSIHITGNTVIDALLSVEDVLKRDGNATSKMQERFPFLTSGKRMILVTGHRRENFGGGFENICSAINLLASQNKDVDFVYPVHLNPNVKEPVERILSGKLNIHLLPPQEYFPFVYLMTKAYLILTDSGGIQEEAPTFRKPVFVMRDTTERPEAVNAGVAKLVGTDTNRIVSEINSLFANQDEYQRMVHATNPFGDGTASQKICQILANTF